MAPPLPTGLALDRTTGNGSCEITGTPDAATSVDTYTVTATNATGEDATPATVSITVVKLVDADGNGLIEIGTLAELNNVRYSLDGAGYKTNASATPDTTGCPSTGCIGYELINDLTFDDDGDGSTWTRNSDGSVTLDAGDDNDTYFVIAGGSSGGWVPIGDRSNRFTAVFEGNGRTITGLATARDLLDIGLFGSTDGADIRNLGLVGNFARKIGTGHARVGGLVGWQRDGTITASYATGDAEGGADTAPVYYVGGLVGWQDRGASITASYATGDVHGGAGGGDRVGGLVGYQYDGTITASWAIGDVDGGAGGGDHVGGLVGEQGFPDIDRNSNTLIFRGGPITASWASGDVDGGAGDSDNVGGLVGWQAGGAITASYATGDADGGAGGSDSVGGLVGGQRGGTITASWGFGSITGWDSVGSSGSDDLPLGVTSPNAFTSASVPASWNAAASNTMGAWDFGNTSQPPALKFADYDGGTMGTAGAYTSGHLFHCADAANAPDDAILIPNCDNLIPGVAASNVLALTADINVVSGKAGTAYVAVLADGADAPTAAAIKSAVARSGGVVAVGNAAVASGRATVSLTGLMESSMYDAYIVVESGGVLGTVMRVNVNTRAAVSVANVLPTTADINVLSGTAGTAYVAVLADGAMAPTAAAVKAARAGSGGVVAVGSMAIVDDRATVSLTGLMGDTAYDVYVVVESGGVLGTVMKVDLTTPMRLADEDGNGLIEIGTLAELNNVRYSLYGTGYKTSASATLNTSGCPTNGCFGYELTTDLTFDKNRSGKTWTRNSNGTVSLDMGDDVDAYFDVNTGGWVPIGRCGASIWCSSAGDAPFNAVFEGNGHTITGLATVRDLPSIGLFGVTGRSAEIRNLGLVGNLARKIGTPRAFVGGLVGYQWGGSITTSYTTGDADSGGASFDYLGGLVGLQSSGTTITASYAIGDVRGGTSTSGSLGGGLVGVQVGGAITASYAMGNIHGGTSGGNRIGGLVGSQSESGTVTASYATGNVYGKGENDTIGGLVGVQQNSTITASYATGNVDGDVGTDRVGSLVGRQNGTNTITASWGFGSKTRGGGTAGIDGSTPRPNNVSSATGLNIGNVPAASWNNATSGTLGAWDFGTTSQTPALKYADYDGTGGSGTDFHCANDADNAPSGAILIPDCGDPISGQGRTVAPPPPALALPDLANASAVSLTAGTRASAILFTNSGGGALTGCAVSPTLPTGLEVSRTAGNASCQITGTPSAASGRTTYRVTATNATGRDSTPATVAITVTVAPGGTDADGDGLIEIKTLAQLNNVRHSLDGAGYKTSASAAAVTTGCPSNACIGYELVNDLTFDKDGGGTWTRSGTTVTLDTGDDDNTYFDIASGGVVWRLGAHRR